jgi:hypothetical protein
VVETLLGEWGYSQVPRVLIAEERIGASDRVPNDYKFYVFDGTVQFIQVCSDRQFDGMRLRYYTAAWESLHAQDGQFPLADVMEPPTGFDQMVAIAERLGTPFDFIRVDLYNIDGEIYLGELTPYPCSGMIQFSPSSFDREAGAFWTLPDLDAQGHVRAPISDLSDVRAAVVRMPL